MYTIPLYSILIIYAAGALLCASLFLVNAGHLLRTGTLTFLSCLITLATFCASLVVLGATWYVLRDAPWNTPLTIWKNSWFGASFTLPSSSDLPPLPLN